MAKADNQANSKNTDGMRIAKAMAHAGLCSRRDAERWIEAGRVTVNGKKLETPTCVVSSKDTVMVDGKPLPDASPLRLWRYHKPRGLMTTHRDPEGRPTVFASLPPDMPRVISIGRLDFSTEGLLLLTTDGALARHLELPATGWLRRYRVRANGRVTQDQLDALKGGVTIDGVNYRDIIAKLDRVQGANVWLTVALREGKNREIKRIAEYLGLNVNRLIRTSFGPFSLAELQSGALDEVKPRILADQLGSKIAGSFGLKPTGPRPVQAKAPKKSRPPPRRHRAR